MAVPVRRIGGHGLDSDAADDLLVRLGGSETTVQRRKARALAGADDTRGARGRRRGRGQRRVAMGRGEAVAAIGVAHLDESSTICGDCRIWRLLIGSTTTPARSKRPNQKIAPSAPRP